MNVLKEIAHVEKRARGAHIQHVNTISYHNIRYNNHPISRYLYTRVQLFAKVRLYKYTLKHWSCYLTVSLAYGRSHSCAVVGDTAERIFICRSVILIIII